MATHSSVLARRIPGTGEPHGLPSMGSHRVGHDWSDLAAVAAPAAGTDYPANSCNFGVPMKRGEGSFYSTILANLPS